MKFSKRLFDVIYQFFLRKHSAKAISSGFFLCHKVYGKNTVQKRRVTHTRATFFARGIASHPTRPPEDLQPIMRGHNSSCSYETRNSCEGKFVRIAISTHRARIQRPSRMGTRSPLEGNSVPTEHSGKSEPKSDQNSCFKRIFEIGSFSLRGSISIVITYDNPFPLKRHTLQKSWITKAICYFINNCRILISSLWEKGLRYTQKTIFLYQRESACRRRIFS